MRGSTPGNPHRGPIKRGHHKSHRGITKGLKSLNMDNQPQVRHDSLSPIHSSPGISPSTSSVNSIFTDELWGPKLPYAPSSHSLDSTESWDIVEDPPLRWASDYVSLAVSGSRLANASILFYDIWSDSTAGGHRGALLVVATKSTVLIYETPKGERAFRFVKVSYPHSPTSKTPSGSIFPVERPSRTFRGLPSLSLMSTDWTYFVHPI